MNCLSSLQLNSENEEVCIVVCREFVIKERGSKVFVNDGVAYVAFLCWHSWQLS